MKFSHKLIAATLTTASLAGIDSVAVANSKADARNLIAVTEVPVTHDHAVSIALQTIPGTVIGSELEHDNTPMLWEVEVVNANGQAFEIYTTTGEVLDQEADYLDDDDDDKDDNDDEQECTESEAQNTP